MTCGFSRSTLSAYPGRISVKHESEAMGRTSWYLTMALSRLSVRWYTRPRKPSATGCCGSSSSAL